MSRGVDESQKTWKPKHVASIDRLLPLPKSDALTDDVQVREGDGWLAEKLGILELDRLMDGWIHRHAMLETQVKCVASAASPACV